MLQAIAEQRNAFKVKTAKLADILARVRTRKEPEIKELMDAIDANKAVLEAWAEKVKDTEFGEKKSIDMLHGTIGFRLGNRALDLLSGVKWETVLERLKGKFKQYIRIKREVDKVKLLKAINDEVIKPADRSSIGVKVVQPETFFVEVKEI